MKKSHTLICIVLIVVLVAVIGIVVFNTVNNKKTSFNEVKVNASSNETTNEMNNVLENETEEEEEDIPLEGTAFKIKNIECQKGDEIIVKIELANDSNFVAANFDYNYDTESMEYIDYEGKGSFENASMLMVNDNNGKIQIGFVTNLEENSVKAGEILDLKFKIKNDVSKEEIKNKFDCTTLKTEDGTDVDFKIKQGVIKIK